MIQLAPQLRILLACQPVDFRNGIDGLAALCQKTLAEDPFSGALVVFRNRQGALHRALALILLQRLSRIEDIDVEEPQEKTDTQ
jgi:transposase